MFALKLHTKSVLDLSAAFKEIFVQTQFHTRGFLTQCFRSCLIVAPVLKGSREQVDSKWRASSEQLVSERLAFGERVYL